MTYAGTAPLKPKYSIIVPHFDWHIFLSEDTVIVVTHAFTTDDDQLIEERNDGLAALIYQFDLL